MRRAPVVSVRPGRGQAGGRVRPWDAGIATAGTTSGSLNLRYRQKEWKNGG